MKSTRLHYGILALLLTLWLGVLLLGGRVADYALHHYGEAIIRASRGKVMDAAFFMQNRLRDGAWLLTMAVALGYLHLLLARVAVRPANHPQIRPFFHGGLLFVSANLWLAAAAHTGLFWCLIYQGADTGGDVYGLFQLKYRLLKEAKAPLKAVILGNSQANRQLDEGLMNEVLRDRLYTGELHWPASHGYDIMLVHRHISPDMAQIVICYTSEILIYSGTAGDALPQFFQWRDIPDFWQMNLLHYMPVRKVGYGLLGDVLPVFAMRDSLSQRILGWGVTGIRQRQVYVGSTNNLETSAQKSAQIMGMSEASRWQKQSFARLVQECGRRQQKLVIIAGQLNPRLGRLLPPALRADMLAFFRELRDHNPHVVLIEDPPYQDVSEYEDLTHVNKEGERAFTLYLAKKLVDLKLVPLPNP